MEIKDQMRALGKMWGPSKIGVKGSWKFLLISTPKNYPYADLQVKITGETSKGKFTWHFFVVYFFFKTEIGSVKFSCWVSRHGGDLQVLWN